MRGTAMITAHDYYENVAKATVTEFQKNNSDLRLALYPSFTGVMRAGQSFLGDKIGGITIHWKEHEYVNLTIALQNVLKLFETDFHELTTGECDSE